MKKTVLTFLIAAAALSVHALTYEVKMSRSDGVYAAGDSVPLTVTAFVTNGLKAASGEVDVILDNFGAREFSRRKIDLSKQNPFKVTATRPTPGMVRLRLRAGSESEFTWGVAFSPEAIRTGSPRPADFDSFWAEAQAKYDREVPVDVKLERLDALKKPNVNVYRLSLTTPHGKTVDGILCEPEDLSRGPFPVRISVPGAGPSMGTASGASTDRISLVMNVHYYPLVVGHHKHSKGNGELLARETAETAAVKEKYGVSRYCYAGISESREAYHYYDCILAISRALDWLWARPEVKKDDFRYSGTSQGGGFGLILAGFNKHITRTVVYVPAITDLLGYLDEDRQSGWPRLTEGQTADRREAAVKNAPYFDAAHFAARIKTPIRVVVGLSDRVCAPAAVWAGYNAIPSENKSIIPVPGMTHSVDERVRAAVGRWYEGAPGVSTPETSPLFVRHEDPETGVVSWLLKPKSFAWNQQSIYFTAKSMTDDGRFLVFDYADDEFKKGAKGKPAPAHKRKAVVDFLTDTIIALPGTDGRIPFLDPVTAKMYYTGNEGIWMNDLRNDPTNRVLICPWPKEFLALGQKNGFLATHPTMNADRTKMFIDTRFDDTFYHGCINLKTGKWEHWGSTPFFLNHGQLCPSDENLAMGAWEVDWVDSKGEHHPIHKIGPDDRYPRMWYLQPGDKRRMIDPGPEMNYATHEMWDEDGRGHYWNNWTGLWHYDRFTEKTEKISPFPAGHSSVSRDNRYVVSDFPVGIGYWRGQAWSVVFYDRQTGGAVFIHSRNDPLCPPEPSSRLHPDPHPAFLCNERYIVTTVNNVDGHMDLCLTPTAALKERCAKPTALGGPLPALAHPIAVGERIGQSFFRMPAKDLALHGDTRTLHDLLLRYAQLTGNHRLMLDIGARGKGSVHKGPEPDPEAVRALALIRAVLAGDVSKCDAARAAWTKVANVESPKDWTTVLTAVNLLLSGGQPAKPLRQLIKPFENLPVTAAPERVGIRLVTQLLNTLPDKYTPPGFVGSYGNGTWLPYAAASLWAHSLRFATLTEDHGLERRLIAKFEPYLPGGPRAATLWPPYHVDDTIVGIIPYEIYRINGDPRCLKLGDYYADTQWTPPCEGTLRARHTPKDPAEARKMQEHYWSLGYSPQTRLWIDDMYMIIAIQEQAARIKKDRTYLNRAAHEMCFYLDELQLKDGAAKGLFYHAPDVHYVWGRGCGWMAAGLALVLSQNPDEPDRAKILQGYKSMMDTLLKFQREDGLWGQLVDEPTSWGETSGSAMFTYAFIVGLTNGWLDETTFGPAARKAYLKLCSMLDKYGNLADVCTGTGKKDDHQYYLDRARINGDPHGQAPLLWCVNALLGWK